MVIFQDHRIVFILFEIKSLVAFVICKMSAGGIFKTPSGKYGIYVGKKVNY